MINLVRLGRLPGCESLAADDPVTRIEGLIIGEAGIEPGSEGSARGQVTLVCHIACRLRWAGSGILQLAAAAAIRSLLNGVAANSRPAGRWPGAERLKWRAACSSGRAAAGTWNTAVVAGAGR